MSLNTIEVGVGTVGPYRVQVTPPEGFPSWDALDSATIEFAYNGTAVGSAIALTTIDANLGIFSFELDATVTGTDRKLDAKLSFGWTGPARTLTSPKGLLFLNVKAVAV